MEVLTAHRNKRTILLVKENSENASQLCKLLADVYNFMVTTNSEEGFSALKRMCDNLSAVLVDSELPDNACEIFLQKVRSNKRLETIPILVISDLETMAQKVNFLALGAVDFITFPYQREIIVNRISNAIHIKDSATFLQLEKMLRALPANIYLKDAEGKYVFATHYWHHIEHDGDPDWTIRGKTDIEIRKDRENAIKAYQSDLELLRTGEGKDYVIEVNADNILEYLQIIKQPVYNDNNEITGIIALINNVTEQEILRRKLERQAHTDELTGLYNRLYFEKYIQSIPPKDYPISIISADCNALKFINDTYGHLVGDEYIRLSAVLFRMVLPENAVMFRMGGDEFLLFVPETSLEKAGYYITELKHQAKLFHIKEQQISISYGACQLENPYHIRQCIEMADTLMYEDKKQYHQQN